MATTTALALGARPAQAAPVKIACIGEHTTHSNLFPNTDRENQPPGMQEYPVFLQQLLGTGYDVRNFGDCCASVVQGYPSSETHPYVSGGNFKNSVAFAPDVVVIGSWGRHDWGLSAMTAFAVFSVAKFQTDYEDMVQRYLALPNHPKIYASLPIPILFGEDGPDRGFKTSPVVEAIKAVAAKHNLPTIDLYSAFLHHKELFINPPDKDSEGEHTNEAGMHVIAQLVRDALLANGATTADGGTTSPGTDASARDAAVTDAKLGNVEPPDAGRGGAGGSTVSPPNGSAGVNGTGGQAGASSGSAGTPATAGASGSGGAIGSGGAAAGAAGGLAGAGREPTSAPDAANGCACHVAARSSGSGSSGWCGALALLGIGMMLVRARRK